jgi:hypothetical protein
MLVVIPLASGRLVGSESAHERGQVVACPNRLATGADEGHSPRPDSKGGIRTGGWMGYGLCRDSL